MKASLLFLLVAAIPALSAPLYVHTFGDYTAQQNPSNSNYYFIPAGADSYAADEYERPTGSTYSDIGGTPSNNYYYRNLDILNVLVGFQDPLDGTDTGSRFLYVAIQMVAANEVDNGSVKNEGLKYFYGFQIGNATDGGIPGGYLFFSDGTSELDNSTWTLDKLFGHRDTNNSVGGPGGLAVPGETGGNGYETNAISDGRTTSGNTPALWARISPTDSATIEFRLDYTVLGYTLQDIHDLLYLVAFTNKGGGSHSQQLWNDHYTSAEAGTPYTTAGLGNIYEMDSLRLGSIAPDETSDIPEPASFVFAALGLGILAVRRRAHR